MAARATVPRTRLPGTAHNAPRRNALVVFAYVLLAILLLGLAYSAFAG
ncbi:hypothetical protein [Halosegnis marinus]|uniref:Uncharacterized protein n=1 Tax=Halosegnis marinus TaxID=3034023 RepID=A0ABD5ZM79_9EURY|nr:hypothetical protein [Halosegnis sp. DT85]